MLVVDGNNLAYRYKRPPFVIFDKQLKIHIPKYTNGEGQATGSIYGVLTSVINLANRFNDKDIIVCWDSKHNLRKSVTAYKANRDHSKDGFILEQMTILHSVLPLFGFNSVRVDGYEADDLAYTFCQNNTGVICCSEDSDFLEYVNPSKKNYVYQKKKVVKEPLDYDFRIYHAVIGSRKDNVIGIPYFRKNIALDFAKNVTTVDTLLSRYGAKYPQLVKFKRTLLQNFDLLTAKEIPDIESHIKKAHYSPLIVRYISKWLAFKDMADRVDSLWR